jgi:hypothetical protein
MAWFIAFITLIITHPTISNLKRYVKNNNMKLHNVDETISFCKIKSYFCKGSPNLLNNLFIMFMVQHSRLFLCDWTNLLFLTLNSAK